MSASTLLDAPPLRAGTYSRISSDDERDEMGVKRQDKSNRRFVDAKGWQLAGVYCDNDTSASKDGVQRKDYRRLLGDIAAGRLDVIVVTEQERLVRKPDELEELMRVLRKAGMRSFWSSTNGAEFRIDSTNSRSAVRMQGVFSIQYAEYISEKVSQKKAQLAEDGLPAGGGTRPFGYEKGGMAVVDAEADLIREAARRTLEGDSLTAIARDWTRRGIPTVTGARWLPNVLRNLLASPRIAGLRAHHGDVVAEAAWPAIVDRATWEQLRAVFDGRKNTRTRPSARRLLTGLLVCGHCGHQLWGALNNGKPAYRCLKGAGKDGCGGTRIAAEPAELWVVEAVLDAWDQSKALAEATRRSTRQGARRQVDDLSRQIKALEAELVEISAQKGRGEIEPFEWKAQRDGIKPRLDDLRHQLSAQDTHSAVAPYVGKPGLLRQDWPTLPVERRRAVIEDTLDGPIVLAPAVRGRARFDGGRLALTFRV